MKNLSADINFLKNILTDFSDEHGDQALLEVMEEWKREKMGGVDRRVLEVLNRISRKVERLNGSIADQNVGYMMAVIDVEKIILKEMQNL